MYRGILACALVGVFPIACGPALAADERPPLTLESIFSGDEFRNESIDDVQWSDDGSRFTFTRRNPESGFLDLHEHDVASGRSRRLLDGSSLELEGRPVDPGAYQWAGDFRYVLVSGPVTRTWDSVLESRWFVYERAKERLRPLAGGKVLRNVRISPDGRRAGYVLDNDLYFADLATGESTRITDDGSADVFNGIF